MPTPTCLECGADLDVPSVEVGEIIDCGECGIELEVLTSSPLSLALAPEEAEDWGE